jgi:hypothetical protein
MAVTQVTGSSEHIGGSRTALEEEAAADGDATALGQLSVVASR